VYATLGSESGDRRLHSEARARPVHHLLLGVTQPRISDLMRGKIDLFSLGAAGLHVEMRISDAA
jgi:hypothetical protein